MMHDYKGMASSWANILGLYHNMEDKHKVHIITENIQNGKFKVQYERVAARELQHRYCVCADSNQTDVTEQKV